MRGRPDRRPDGCITYIPALQLGSKPSTKQYRVQVANREDFATTVEDVRTDSTSLAPTLTSTLYLSGRTFWWKVAAYDEDNNVGDFTRAHSFTLEDDRRGRNSRLAAPAHLLRRRPRIE